MKNFKSVVVLGALAAVCGLGAAARADSILVTFAAGDYDNTANTVTGTNAVPVYNNLQTTGKFRDVFWWGTAYNGGTAGVGSPDFINSGPNLISNNGSPARATPGGDDTALNFTGQRTSGGASFMSVYDTTPGNGTTTRNVFTATGGLQVSADVLFAPGQHSVGGGIVALYGEGQDGLALLAHNGGGNNPDHSQLSLIFQQGGVPLTLLSNAIDDQSFVGDTVGGVATGTGSGDHWYRITMDLTASGDTWSVNGSFKGHVDPTDPNSALLAGPAIATLSLSGSLLDPDASARILLNPGEVGLMAYTSESFSDGLGTGGTGANPLTDNIGVSLTNFRITTPVPLPSAVWAGMLLLGGLGVNHWRKNRRALRGN